MDSTTFVPDFANSTHTPITSDTKIKEPDEEIHLIELRREFTILAIGTTFIAVVSLGKIIYHKISWLSSSVPESCMLIIAGLLGGVIIYALSLLPGNSNWQNILRMDTWMFYMILLPPICLEASYSLHGRTFFENILEILVYAIFGTVLAFVIVGALFRLGLSLWGVSSAGIMGGGLKVGLLPSLLFSSYIVAVDPVAILAIFQDLGVDKCLYFMVFGESLLNDGVALVLYEVMISFNMMHNIAITSVIFGFIRFFVVAIGGSFIGLVGGALSSYILKYTSHVGVVEPLVIFVFAYFSYTVALLFSLSGILGLIACGLIQAQYAFHNMQAKSRTTVQFFSKTAANLCEAIIFLYLGLELVQLLVDVKTWRNWGFYLWSIVLCIVSRFFVTYFLTFLLNLGRIRKITLTEQFIMAYGGLRGAIAFSLSLTLDPAMLERNGLTRELFVHCTLIVIIFTSFLQGILTKPLVKLLRIRLEEFKPLSLMDEIQSRMYDHTTAAIEGVIGRRGSNFLRELLLSVDNLCISKFLLKYPDATGDQITSAYQKISLQMHYALLNQDSSAFEHALSKLPPGLAERILAQGPQNENEILEPPQPNNESTVSLAELQVEEAPGATTITAANGRAERIEVEAADGDAEGAQERQSTSTIGSARELFRRLSLKPEDVESAHKLTRNLDLYEPAHDDARALVQLKKRRFWLYLLEKAKQRQQHKAQERRQALQLLRNTSINANGTPQRPRADTTSRDPGGNGNGGGTLEAASAHEAKSGTGRAKSGTVPRVRSAGSVLGAGDSFGGNAEKVSTIGGRYTKQKQQTQQPFRLNTLPRASRGSVDLSELYTLHDEQPPSISDFLPAAKKRSAEGIKRIESSRDPNEKQNGDSRQGGTLKRAIGNQNQANGHVNIALEKDEAESRI